MKAPRVGYLWRSLKRYRTVTSPLGAALLGVSLALALILAGFASPTSQAAPLRSERDNSSSDLSITLAPVYAAPPVPALQSPADGAWNTQSNVEFRWQDVGAPTYNLRVDSEVYTTTEISVVLSLSDGAHRWTVQALSELGEASGYAEENLGVALRGKLDGPFLIADSVPFVDQIIYPQLDFQFGI